MQRTRIAAAVVALFAAGSVQAQAPVAREKIEVTGSNIKRVDTETASPVSVITREQIRESGKRDVAELLRTYSAANAGSQLDNFSGNFSAGAQTVSLRGLGSAGTLVLVNSRRMSPSAFADPNNGNSTVYNINAIPIDAIDRIEILKDGASAIYGSDAMAGVVNIILRRDFRGGEASASYSTNDDGMWTSWRGSATVGIGDLEKDSWNVLASLEHYHRDPVRIKDLKNIPADDLSRLGNWRVTQSANGYPANYFRENVLGNGNFATFVGVDRNCPAERIINNRCRYDSYNDIGSEFRQDRDDFFARGTMGLGAGMQAFGELLYSRVKTYYFTTPQGISNTFAVWANSAGDVRQYRIILPVGHPDNPTNVPVAAAYSFADVGRRRQDQTIDTTRALAGLKGVLGAWDYETGLLWMKIDKGDRYSGYISFPGLVAAVADRSYRFDGRVNDPAVLNNVGLSFAESGEATITDWDLRGSRELMDLAGGPAAVAAGVEARKEKLLLTPDSRITSGNVVGRGTSAADGSRDVAALYAELSVPFVKRVETQLAVRTEHYSDFGTSTTPKIGVKYMPVDIVAVRGTYAKGFRAPSLSQISPSAVQSFFTAVRDPLRCPTLSTANPDCSFNLATIIRSNTELQPEKSDNYTAGFIFSPTKDINVAVDYWYIKRKNQIDRFSPTYILAREPQFPGAVVRDTNPATWLPGVANSGPVLFVYRQFFNLASTEASGVDIDASWRFNIREWGRLTATFNGTYLAHYKYALAKTDPIIDQVGTFGGPSDPLPRFRGNGALKWDRGPVSVTAAVNYISGWFDGAAGTAAQGGGCFFPAGLLQNPDCKVKPWTTFDVGATYMGIKDLTLGILVRNVTDKAAPYEPAAAQTTQAGFNTQFHNALGRFYTFNVTYRFK